MLLGSCSAFDNSRTVAHGTVHRACKLASTLPPGTADRVAARGPRALCNELAPCSQKLVDAFGIPDHLVAAPIATSAPSCMLACYNLPVLRRSAVLMPGPFLWHARTAQLPAP